MKRRSYWHSNLRSDRHYAKSNWPAMWEIPSVEPRFRDIWGQSKNPVLDIWGRSKNRRSGVKTWRQGNAGLTDCGRSVARYARPETTATMRAGISRTRAKRDNNRQVGFAAGSGLKACADWLRDAGKGIGAKIEA